ncbi:site-specific integrase [Dickeya fangzhongdai]|uniref:site-specific integrase n=1 Tax=Dickeya fangzhongdai TaxID=1778540 RepID=UPI0026E10660|nr:site-specific integrase [Dickeya fangzhongdai]WKV52168.1 site-specific integrase [Dickeya fangzhongdai]
MIQSKTIPYLNNDNRQIAANSYYEFFKTDKVWVLDKDVKINTSLVLDILNPIHHKSFLDTLSCFATTRSSTYTYGLFFAFHDYIKSTDNGVITEDNIEYYRGKAFNDKTDFLNSMRAFFNKWLKLGYEGVSENHVSILYRGKLKRRKIGEMVKVKDSKKGPLSENDIILFNESAMWLYENEYITLEYLTMALLTSYTGRRPIQTSHLKLKDLSNFFDENKKYSSINYPRAKHSGEFRSEFTMLKITESLNDLVLSLAEKNIHFFEKWCGRTIVIDEQKEIPLFINYKAIRNYKNKNDIFDLMSMDYFHIKNSWITMVIKDIAKKTHELSNSESINAIRFRYSLGTRAAQEGYSEYIIAQLLDHRSIRCVSAYVQNIPEHAIRIDEMMTSEISKYAKAFKGEIIKSDSGQQKIRNHIGVNSGNCSNCKDCCAPVPIPCYTCPYFKPWLEAPHQEIYDYLLTERERISEITKDTKVTFALDRTISAVLEVINKCNFIKNQERNNDNNNKH